MCVASLQVQAPVLDLIVRDGYEAVASIDLLLTRCSVVVAP